MKRTYALLVAACFAAPFAYAGPVNIGAPAGNVVIIDPATGNAANGSTTTGTVNQGTPNAGGVNAWPVNPDSVADGVIQTGSVTSATTVLSFPNTAGYGYIAFGFTSAGSGNTVVVDGAPDGVTYNQTLGFWSETGSGVQQTVSTATLTNTFVVPVTNQAMRLRVSIYGSGTITAYGVLKRGVPPNSAFVTIFGDRGSGSADSGNPVKTGGVYTTGPTAVTTGQRVNDWSDQFGNKGYSPQCGGCVSETASATGTTAATTATLAAAAGKTTYICGFSIRANATAAATGNATVTGTITTLNFTQWTAPLASGLGITEPPLGTNCIPASGTNQAIAVVSAAPGSGGVVSVSAWGFQQ